MAWIKIEVKNPVGSKDIPKALKGPFSAPKMEICPLSRFIFFPIPRVKKNENAKQREFLFSQKKPGKLFHTKLPKKA